MIFRGVGIAYIETIDQHDYLRYAHYSCQVLHPCGDWEYEYVFSLTDAMYPSLQFDSTNEPHIAFYTPGYTSPTPAFNGALRYTIHTTPGGSGWTAWVVQHGNTPPGGQIGENQLGVGLYPSLALNSTDRPRIAYFGSDYSNLNYAVYVGNNTGSCFNDDWDCQVIDDLEANTGMFPSLAIVEGSRVESAQGGGDVAYIAYYEQSTGRLKVADNWVSDNCGVGNNWRCQDIADMGVLPLNDSADYYLIHAGLSLALDNGFYPIVAYMDASDEQGPSVLKLARPASALGQLTGNCGPMGFWQCSLLASPPVGDVYEADYASLAIAPNGLGMIVYSEDQSWYNQGWRLNLAFQQFGLYLPLVQK
jgi:hypothetical protein